MANDQKHVSMAMDSLTVNQIKDGLGGLQKSLTVTHLKDAMASVAPIAAQGGTSQPVTSTQSPTQSIDQK
jgi:hypothetical protein